MSSALKKYIESARAQHQNDDQIKHALISGGWSESDVTAAIEGHEPLVVPVPPPPPPPAPGSVNSPVVGMPAPAPSPAFSPQPVVQSLSTRGLEYTIMFIALGVSALALGNILHSSVNTLFGVENSFFTEDGIVSFAAAALLAGFPIWGFLFIRLKRAEHDDPTLLQDPSRKRSVQLLMVVTFLIGLGNIIFFVYNIMSGGSSSFDFD